MKKNIGNYNAAFPTPIVVVGAMTDGRPNWFEVAWCGIGDRDLVTLSVEESHETCRGIFADKRLSISLCDEALLPRADYVGIVSGKKVDKSGVFAWTPGELGAPIPDDAPVSMECELVDTYKQHGMCLLICRVRNTYVDEQYLDEKQKVDYSRLKPVLFEPRFRYLLTGKDLGPCIEPGRALQKHLTENQ
ncbi:MAG: flavin reductase family protein [Alloprevotella sp.]|nr:flavin reductase family protein [Alloprevotella sp.]